MKKRKMGHSFLVLLLLLAILTGCGAASVKADNNRMECTVAESSSMEYAEEEMEASDMAALTTSVADRAEQAEPQNATDYAEKIIYSGDVYLETTDFDASVAALEQAVQTYGGFVQTSSINGNSRSNADGTTSIVNRWGDYTVRIPSDRFEEFMTMTGTMGNVTSSSRSAENVTSQYTDYEAQLESLNTQQERLLAMLEQSGDLESLIQLEARLSEVRYEIDSLQRNLRNLDQRLIYSTVTLQLQEVAVYTPTAAVQRSFGEKVGTAFRDGWQSFLDGVQRVTVTLVYIMPVLLLLAVLLAAVLLLRKHVRKTRAKKQDASHQSHTEE